jgi:DNA-binding transcriptional LysR family regulator
MAQSDRAIRRAQLAESGQIGLVRIGFVASASTSILPMLLRDFTQAAPTVTLELHEMSTSSQLRSIRNRGIDIALVRPPVWDQILSVETIADEPLVVALPKTHRLARSDEPIALSELANEDFIQFRREITPGFYDMLVELCHNAGFNPNVAHECNSFMTALALVTGDLGISLVPRSLTPHLTRMDGRFRELRDPDASAGWAIAWIDEVTETRPDVKGFVDVSLGMRESFRSLLKSY